VGPARAANSHSAAVGMRYPRPGCAAFNAAMNCCASAVVTLSTGHRLQVRDCRAVRGGRAGAAVAATTGAEGEHERHDYAGADETCEKIGHDQGGKRTRQDLSDEHPAPA
jgi:hypothetical protein